MSCDPLVIAEDIGKTYRLFDRPWKRLWHLLGGTAHAAEEYRVLDGISFRLGHGEVLGLVGRNGAGKSTLLRIIAHTLPPTRGKLSIGGRTAALLELGSGFNPEFTGRENIFLNAAILGLSDTEIRARFDDIVAFSELADHIDHPVKTYSSGMFVRLAFSIATSVDADLLIIDEALSVGDGAFARKSFDRILDQRERGVGIIFCSHNLHQVETLCDHALWLEKGCAIAYGPPAAVLPQYNEFLDSLAGGQPEETPTLQPNVSHARFRTIRVSMDGAAGPPLVGRTGESTLAVDVEFDSDPKMPAPTLAVTVSSENGRIISSAGSWLDGVTLNRGPDGRGSAAVCFPNLPLFKGTYRVGAYLFCERGLHTYDWANPAAFFTIEQQGVERGYFRLPHEWQVDY